MSHPIMLYAILSYCLFLCVFVWMAAFLLDIAAIRSSAPDAPWQIAVAIDIALISIFCLAHSIMARPAFKRIWTRIITSAAERATYVLQSSVLLGAILLFWRPIDTTVWNIKDSFAIPVLIVFFAGLGLIVPATFLLDHFEFTGLRQAWDNLRASAGPRHCPDGIGPHPHQ